MQPRRLVDRQREGLRHRQPVAVLLVKFGMVLGRRVLPGVEQPGRRGIEPSAIFGKGDRQSLAIGGGLLMRQRQAAERFGQILSRWPLGDATGASDQEVGGHAVMAVGYSDASQRFLIRNSWGPKWGINGYFTLPYEYVTNSEMTSDLWTIRLVQ